MSVEGAVTLACNAGGRCGGVEAAIGRRCCPSSYNRNAGWRFGVWEGVMSSTSYLISGLQGRSALWGCGRM